MKMRAIALCAAALFLPLTAACSDSDSGGKPDGSDKDITVGGSTVAQLSEQLQAGGVSKPQADCLAQAYGELDLDADELEKLQQGDTSVLDPQNMTAYARTAAECMSK